MSSIVNTNINEMEELQQDSIMSQSQSNPKHLVKSGPLTLDASCISCSSKPAHTV